MQVALASIILLAAVIFFLGPLIIIITIMLCICFILGIVWSIETLHKELG